MMYPDQWNTQSWLVPVLLLGVVAVLVAVYSYVTQIRSWLSLLGLTVKTLAIIGLGICLLEPQSRLQKAEPGANAFVVMVDRSESLQLKDPGSSQTRAEQLKQTLESPDWLQHLESQFQLRKYMVDRQLEAVTHFDGFQAQGAASNLLTGLQQTLNRPAGKPLAGILILTDGNASDHPLWNDWNQQDLQVPIYPVIVGSPESPKDLSIDDVVASQSNFEAAPATFQVRIGSHGFAGTTATLKLFDEEDQVLDQKDISGFQDGKPLMVQLRTTKKVPGVSVYRIEVAAKARSAGETSPGEADLEATLANNQRFVVVDRGRSPLRVLYVCGRPNWELKYLRRAVFDDQELQLVALIRIAKREAKFTFRGRDGQDSNSLFRGFENQNDDTAERFDEPVFLRLGTEDSEELRGGFPKSAAELFRYDAVILDDVESSFFTQDQQTLLQEFASLRGGGVMMLGGQESFAAGEYWQSAIGQMLPVYLDGTTLKPSPDHTFSLTREGWLQPWVRIHSTEKEEQKRLQQMPRFFTLNPVRAIKPGATVLAEVTDQAEQTFPALVTQPFGRGRTAAWLVGDLWRWQLKSEVDNDDLLAFWRQVMRWLVSDVPDRCQLTIQEDVENASIRNLTVQLYDQEFLPCDNATINLTITQPDGSQLPISVRPNDEFAGQYVAQFYGNEPGVYRVNVQAMPADQTETLTAESAWVCQPQIQEFAQLVPQRQWMQDIADATGGQMVNLDGLPSLVNDLPNRKVPVSKTVTEMWWHRWPIFLSCLCLLVFEWGLRRWRGLP